MKNSFPRILRLAHRSPINKLLRRHHRFDPKQFQPNFRRWTSQGLLGQQKTKSWELLDHVHFGKNLLACSMLR